MKNRSPLPLLSWAPAVAGALAVSSALAWVMNLRWPHVGFDFRVFLPALLDVRLHQLQEGWSQVQWWTPSFGAGLPAFANPQHTQFMPAQFFVPWLGPWGAAVLQACLLLLVGMLLLFHTCRRLLGCSVPASLLAGLVFGTCGFFWDHALSGHVSFNVFPLVTVIPLALHGGTSARRAIALLGLTGAAIIYGGGYTVILVYALTALLLTWLLPLWRPEAFDLRTSAVRLLLGALLCGLIGGAKIVACMHYLAQFPRLMDYQFAGPAWLAPLALLSQTLGLRTVAMLSRWLPISVPGIQSRFPVGEDVGYGPMVAVVLLMGFILVWRQHRDSFRTRRWIWIGLLGATWLAAEAALGRGLLWPLLKPLPVLRTLHENHRLASAFALPLALLFAPAWDSFVARLTNRLRLTALVGALLLTLASLEPYVRDRGTFWWSDFDATTVEQTWRHLRENPTERFIIREVADVTADAVFLAHASNWKPYEPIFGYGYPGPAFKVRITPGPVEPLSTASGAWRFHHPLSFVAPSLAGAVPFDPIPARESAALLQFLQRRQPGWPLPPAQHLANWVTLAALVAAASLLLWPSRAPEPRGVSPTPVSAS